MPIPGETVAIVSSTGGGYDDDGHWIPPRESRRTIAGCVIVPRGADTTAGLDYVLAGQDISILAPTFVSVAVGAEVEVRGQRWIVAAPTFDHRSPFGTGFGGTEIPVTRKETV